jgi:hypothetical protein
MSFRSPPTDSKETAFALWGGILDGVDLDLVNGTAVLRTHVINGGVEASTTIACEGIRAVAFGTDTPWPWAYAEITEVWAGPVEGGVRIAMTLWSEPTALTITANRIFIGDQPLEAPFASVARDLT